MRTMRFLPALLLSLFLAACAAPVTSTDPSGTAAAAPEANTPAPILPPTQQPTPLTGEGKLETRPNTIVVDYSCKTDADCSIKDVGNCCGSYPACVNKDSATDPAGVMAQCKADGMSSVCGFPSISSCQCVQGRCSGSSIAGGLPAVR